jgi:hypothetical protein
LQLEDVKLEAKKLLDEKNLDAETEHIIIHLMIKLNEMEIAFNNSLIKLIEKDIAIEKLDNTDNYKKGAAKALEYAIRVIKKYKEQVIYE